MKYITKFCCNSLSEIVGVCVARIVKPFFAEIIDFVKRNLSSIVARFELDEFHFHLSDIGFS